VKPLGFAILISVAVIALDPGAARSQPKRPKDFAIRLAYGVAGRCSLDTVKGTYTHDMVVDPSVTIPMQLTDAEMDTVYQLVREAKFFSYSKPIRNDGHMMRWSPETVVRLFVRAGGKTREIEFSQPQPVHPDESTRRVKTLMFTIMRMIERKPEYKALPRPRAGYI
jgi:hypothetical protein